MGVLQMQAYFRVLSLPILGITCALSTFAQVKQLQKQPVDYVNPEIGGISILLTSTEPYVQYPHGMARLAPIMPGASDHYLADKIFGFPAGPAILRAFNDRTSGNSYSRFDHDFEIVTPYYYEVVLQDSDIKAEMTATMHDAFYRFTFPGENSHLSLEMRGANLKQIGLSALQGSTGNEYFYADFSKPLGEMHGGIVGPGIGAGDRIGGRNGLGVGGTTITLVADQMTKPGEQIEVRVGISYISVEQAHKNLDEEISKQSFEQVKAKTRAVWNKVLSQATITGGTEKQKTIFYTAMYHALGRMTDITEDGRYYSGFDHQIHDAGGHDFYVDDGLWDTYRSEHPLQLLLDARGQQDIVRSYLRMYEQSGWLPSFPGLTGDRAVMIGHHSTAFITDVYEKGYRDFDAEEAYTAMKKNAMESTMLPWRRGPVTDLDKVYLEKGFFPALAKGEAETNRAVFPRERRQAVAVTLENAYDDWCLAQMAKALGKMEDYDYFSKRAQNYKNLWNPAIGFMAPKTADGNWVAGFDPKLGGGPGGRDYFAEVNSWIYSFSAQQDIAGLIDLMGGRDRFNTKLDQLFVEQYGAQSKWNFLAQFPDATGLVGQYAQGNEPSFHIPYLYDFSGEPWKTQQRVRQMMDVWYTDGPMGIPGDDDGGATSSWYVLSAMGFYPVCPGSPVYEIGSPLFATTRLTLGNGKVFTIEALHVSAQNKYIQSATLNGKPLDHAWFLHSEIANGGTLALVMGPRPNKMWGSAMSAAPPSFTQPN
jgi:predicted alpha-1,2-mannosidase